MILVTGAAGRIGRDLVLRLSGGGRRVRALVRDPEKALALRNPNVEIAVADASRPEKLSGLMKGIDHVFLLTSADPRQAEIQGHLVDAARRGGVRHVVKLSVHGASSESPLALARWHAETEKQIEASGMDWTHLRPYYYMQNLLAYSDSVASERTLSAPVGDARIAMVDARDVAAVAAVVLSQEGHAGRLYELTGPEAVSFEEVARKIARVTERPVAYVDASPDEARRDLLAEGRPEWLVDDMLTLFALFRSGHGAGVTDAVQRVTGFEPRSVDGFVRDHAFTFGA